MFEHSLLDVFRLPFYLIRIARTTDDDSECIGIVQFIPTRLTLDSAVTRPPPLLCEADLLSCMDKVSKTVLFAPF